MDEKFNKKTKSELIEEYGKRLGITPPYVSDLVRGEYEPKILVRCVEDLEKSAEKITGSIEKFRESIEKISEKSDKLSSRLLWLNIVLTIATVIAAVATLVLSIPIFKTIIL
ncbi:hypothetical protein KKG29_03580 [Patescibacteria group bacterium]|nr:hypothetical protein [Patescibacteria group bacterium]MBU4000224.1 hypothetical protein [Patescibacteria group bacterium]MBU4368978.1 hypothetical protein [Patescibacteria group bacterium]